MATNGQKPFSFAETHKAAKRDYPDKLIFVEIGDFYETYNGDAEILCKVLELHGHRNSKGDYFMGFPKHMYDCYSQILKKEGYKCLTIKPAK